MTAAATALQALKAKAQLVWRNVTVEPVIVLYLTAVGLNQVTRPNLLLQKACIKKFNYTYEFCNDVIYNQGNSSALGDLQKVVSGYESNLAFAAFVPRIIFSLLAGYWSDRYGET